jgi:hypothetical protein
MDLAAMAAGLTSALLHAGLSVAVRASGTPVHTSVAQMTIAAVIRLPALAWVGQPPVEAWGLTAAYVIRDASAVRAACRPGATASWCR